jgi:hypothetical protein
MYRLILRLHHWSGDWLARYYARRAATLRMFDGEPQEAEDLGPVWCLDDLVPDSVWHYHADRMKPALCNQSSPLHSIISIGFPQGSYELCEKCKEMYFLFEEQPSAETLRSRQRPSGSPVRLDAS